MNAVARMLAYSKGERATLTPRQRRRMDHKIGHQLAQAVREAARHDKDALLGTPQD